MNLVNLSRDLRRRQETISSCSSALFLEKYDIQESGVSITVDVMYFYGNVSMGSQRFHNFRGDFVEKRKNHDYYFKKIVKSSGGLNFVIQITKQANAALVKKKIRIQFFDA